MPCPRASRWHKLVDGSPRRLSRARRRMPSRLGHRWWHEGGRFGGRARGELGASCKGGEEGGPKIRASLPLPRRPGCGGATGSAHVAPRSLLIFGVAASSSSSNSTVFICRLHYWPATARGALSTRRRHLIVRAHKLFKVSVVLERVRWLLALPFAVGVPLWLRAEQFLVAGLWQQLVGQPATRSSGGLRRYAARRRCCTSPDLPVARAFFPLPVHV